MILNCIGIFDHIPPENDQLKSLLTNIAISFVIPKFLPFLKFRQKQFFQNYRNFKTSSEYFIDNFALLIL